jgi:hypothetical protein
MNRRHQRFGVKTPSGERGPPDGDKVHGPPGWRLFGGFAQTMFQFLNQFREPYRGRGIGCSPHQSAAQFKLPFELFPVTLLIHDGTLPLYETMGTAQLQRPSVVRIYSRRTRPTTTNRGLSIHVEVGPDLVVDRP